MYMLCETNINRYKILSSEFGLSQLFFIFIFVFVFFYFGRTWRCGKNSKFWPKTHGAGVWISPTYSALSRGKLSRVGTSESICIYRSTICLPKEML